MNVANDAHQTTAFIVAAVLGHDDYLNERRDLTSCRKCRKVPDRRTADVPPSPATSAILTRIPFLALLVEKGIKVNRPGVGRTRAALRRGLARRIAAHTVILHVVCHRVGL